MSASAAADLARPRRQWIWAIVAIVTSFTVVMPVAFRIGLKGAINHQIAPLTVFHRPVGELQVDAPGQGVTVIRGRPGEVTIQSTMSWLLGEPTVHPVWHGTTLRITASCPSFNAFEDCQVGLVIRVPANAAVRVAIGSGSTAVAGLSGPIHLSASSGSLHLTDVSGPVWATASSGLISAASGLTSPRVVAAVGSGRLELGFAAPPEALALKVGSGSAEITVPPGAHYRVAVERGAGFLRIASGLSDSAAARTITAIVGSGHFAISYQRLGPPPAPSAPPARA
jgi:hypothetical protein